MKKAIIRFKKIVTFVIGVATLWLIKIAIVVGVTTIVVGVAKIVIDCDNCENCDNCDQINPPICVTNLKPSPFRVAFCLILAWIFLGDKEHTLHRRYMYAISLMIVLKIVREMVFQVNSFQFQIKCRTSICQFSYYSVSV